MIVLCFSALLISAVSLGPQPVTPDIDTDVWVSHTNDSPGSDDGYTAGFIGGVDIGSWRLAGSYELLTERPVRRTDQLTAAASYVVHSKSVELYVGLGGRWAGGFGGESLQNEWHRFTGANHTELQYDDSAWRPLVVAGSSGAARLSREWALSAQVDLVGSYDFIESEIIARVVFGYEGRIWAGPRYAFHAGDYMAPTGESAFSAWDDVGFSAGVVLSDSIHLRGTWAHDRFYGTLSLEF